MKDSKMKNVVLLLYDKYALKPFWLIFIILSIYYFINGNYFLGIIFVIAIFILGIIGSNLYKQTTYVDLMKGTAPTSEGIQDRIGTELTDEEATKMSKATISLVMLISLLALILLLYYELVWYLIIILVIGIGYFFLFLLGLIPSLLIRKKLKLK